MHAKTAELPKAEHFKFHLNQSTAFWSLSHVGGQGITKLSYCQTIMDLKLVYFCCQCNDGPKVETVQPQCVLCNHIPCARCKLAIWNVNPDSPSANTEQNHQDWERKEDSEAVDTRQAPRHRDQRLLQPSPKDADPSDAESVVPLQKHPGSYDIKSTAEKIAFALSSDYEICVLCKNALDVDDQRLGLLQSLLKKYGEELEGTPGDIHNIAGQFIQLFSRSTAIAVVRSLDLSCQDIWKSDIPQHLSHAYGIDLNDKADDYEESNLLTLQHINPDDLWRVLMVGRASENLRHNLHLLVHPNKDLGKIDYMLSDLTNIPYHLKQTVSRWLRPGVKRGYMRAEWECVCLDHIFSPRIGMNQT